MKKILDLAEQYGIAAAVHMNNGPVAMFASVHAVAASNNFLCMEFHDTDRMEQYCSLVDVPGMTKPYIQDGYVAVPNGPGFGFELNEEAIRQYGRIRNDQEIFTDPTNPGTGTGFQRRGGGRGRGMTSGRLWSKDTSSKFIKDSTLKS